MRYASWSTCSIGFGASFSMLSSNDVLDIDIFTWNLLVFRWEPMASNSISMTLRIGTKRGTKELLFHLRLIDSLTSCKTFHQENTGEGVCRTIVLGEIQPCTPTSPSERHISFLDLGLGLLIIREDGMGSVIGGRELGKPFNR